MTARVLLLEDIPARQVVRFWERVEKTESCWLWHGSRRADGYGRFSWGPKDARVQCYAHRVSCVLAGRLLDVSLVLDHLCRNTSCVNPVHLEEVSSGVNVLRGVGVSAKCAQKTHCPKGHLLSGENVYIEFLSDGREKRHCKTCRKAGNDFNNEKRKRLLREKVDARVFKG